MSLKLRASKKQRIFDLPLSFRIGESRDRLRDALNVFSNQGRLETRFGRSLFNEIELSGPVLSLSYFKHANGSRYLIAKIGANLVVVNDIGAHTVVKTGLDPLTKHRVITWARGVTSRHIISLGTDGLFQFNGTTFTQLGQEAPIAPTVATAAGTLPDATYKVYLTFYSSTTGFESNASEGSVAITTTAQGLGLSAIPTTAQNATIDHVRIYYKDITSPDDPLFAGEISLGTSTFIISDPTTSTETHPLSNAKPLNGGGKFLTEFNRKLVYSGNDTYKNDVFFSEEDMPDAFNDGTGPDRLVLSPIYDGEITGIARGLYNNTVLSPYLVIFKRRSTHIYSEIGGPDNGTLVPISSEIGCVSHDSIIVKNGNVYFMSANGWREIVNGQITRDEKRNALTLGKGDIDDIFISPGYAYEINKSRLSDTFSVYYSTLDQYMTWVCEGAENDFAKTYVYEFKLGGFKAYEFNTPSTCACLGEDENGNEVVFMGDANGRVYTHSTSQPRSDHDNSGVEQPIFAFALMTWLDGDDMDSTFNFRELILRRVAGVGDLIARAWVNFSLDSGTSSYTFENAQTGFVLDVSKLDEDKFGEDERTIVTRRTDINQCGENILIGFYQNEIGKNIGLVSSQIDFNKNGNRN